MHFKFIWMHLNVTQARSQRWDVRVRTAADTCELGVDQGLECADMTGSTARLLLMLTTPSESLGSHMISNDWSWSESLGAKALKNGPLWPFRWVQELSGQEQLMQLFVQCKVFFSLSLSVLLYFCSIFCFYNLPKNALWFKVFMIRAKPSPGVWPWRASSVSSAIWPVQQA